VPSRDRTGALVRTTVILGGVPVSRLSPYSKESVSLPSPEGLTGIQAVDPPESTGYRSLIRAGLRAAERPEFGEELARTARQIISRAPAGPFDLVSAFINPFCLASVCRLVARPEPEVNLLEVYTKAHQVAMDSEIIEATLRESSVPFRAPITLTGSERSGPAR
jgi:hypothetical protein